MGKQNSGHQGGRRTSGGETNVGTPTRHDRSACSSCGEVQGRHKATCPNR